MARTGAVPRRAALEDNPAAGQNVGIGGPERQSETKGQAPDDQRKQRTEPTRPQGQCNGASQAKVRGIADEITTTGNRSAKSSDYGFKSLERQPRTQGSRQGNGPNSKRRKRR